MNLVVFVCCFLMGIENVEISVIVEPDMPFWTTQDTRNALISTMIPAAVAGSAFCMFTNDGEVTKWWSVCEN